MFINFFRIMRIYISAFLLLFFVLTGHTQTTIINGTAPGAGGKTIELTAPADLITFLEKPLGKVQIGADGKFSLPVKIERTMDAILSINFHKAEMFIEPGKTYKIQIDSINYKDEKEVNPFIQSQNLKLQIFFEDPNELNWVVSDFNNLCSTFLLENFNALYKNHLTAKVDTFRVQMKTRFAAAKNEYFTAYMAYKFASLEQLTRYYSQAELAKRYFTDKPVLYLNLEYMEFFNSYFSKYITATSRALHLVDYMQLLKGADPYAALMKTLAADTLLRNEQLKELVLLKGMMELYNTANYKQEEVLAVINAVHERSIFPDNKEIAANIRTVLTKLKPGTQAPAFTLFDANKKPVSLKDFKGKGVVLSFWTTYCQGCLSEMDLIRPLFDKYHDKAEFVSVCADADPMKMHFFVSMKKDFIWTFLHIGDSSGVLSDYDVRSYPLFVLIDRSGNIFQYPAVQPSEGLDAAIQKMIQQ